MTREKQREQRARQQHMRQMAQKSREAAKGPMDLSFLLLTLLLTVVGLVMLFSASFPEAYYNHDGDAAYYLKRQGFFAVAGLTAMFFVAKSNYQRWRGAAKLLLWTSIALLIFVIVPKNPLAITSNNATRWINLGLFTFQPSEIAKLAIIVYFADSISKKREKMITWKYGIKPYILILVPIGALMMLEPHLSGTILIFGTALIMMIVGGMHRLLVGAGVASVGIVGAAYVFAVEHGKIHYGASRIEMWQNPWIDPLNDGFQMCQSLIAIGSGGLLGTGLGRSRQKFLYLPERQNDFIFAVVCEELGLIGACVIMLIFALLILRGFWIALHARDRFGTLLVVGIMTHLSLQTFLNIAVVTGLVPATGISLPFFSYGGTALVLQLVEMGIVLSVSRQIPAPRNG